MIKLKKEPHDMSPILRVIESASCPTLTGRSELSYHIAVDAKEVLYLKLTSNTGGGHYSDEWIVYNDAKSAFPLAPPARSPSENSLKTIP